MTTIGHFLVFFKKKKRMSYIMSSAHLYNSSLIRTFVIKKLATIAWFKIPSRNMNDYIHYSLL